MMAAKLRAYLELLRPHNLVVAALTTLIGYVTVLAAHGVIETRLLWEETLSYAVAAVVLVAAAGYVINDYYDVGSDAVSKPWRPIPSGRVGRREALSIAAVLFIAGLAVSLPLGPVAVAFVAANAASVYLYSARVKRTGFMGNVLVAANSAATIVLGALAACYATRSHCPSIVLVPVAVAFLLVLGREIVKGIEDYWGDLQECYMTLAVRLGPVKAARIAALVLALTAAASAVPPLAASGYGVAYMLLAAATDATILYSVLALLKVEETEEAIDVSRRLRSILKVSFLLGAMAFLLGPIF